MAAGRRTSSEAISTLRRPCSVRRLASLAVVVVLPEPCRPTIMIGTGAGALRSIGSPCAPSVSISWSCTILTTSWPGVTDLITSTPTAFALHLVGEGAHHVERDVGLQQRAPHLAQRRVDVGLGQRAAPRQAVEDAAKPFRQTVRTDDPSFEAHCGRPQTPQWRPRAHRAVGRWPPASRDRSASSISALFESARNLWAG